MAAVKICVFVALLVCWSQIADVSSFVAGRDNIPPNPDMNPMMPYGQVPMAAGGFVKSKDRPPEEMDEAVMHPPRVPQQPVADSEATNMDIGDFPLGDDFIDRLDREEIPLHPPFPPEAMQTGVFKSNSKPPEEMEDEIMHPRRTPKKQSGLRQEEIPDQFTYDVNVQEALGVDFIDRLDREEIPLHPPFPPEAMQTGAFKSNLQPPEEMDEEVMHPRRTPKKETRRQEEARDDPFADKTADVQDVLGADIVERMDLEDAGMHPPFSSRDMDSIPGHSRFTRDVDGRAKRSVRNVKKPIPGRDEGVNLLASPFGDPKLKHIMMKKPPQLPRFKYPMHASCAINWTTDMSCSDVSNLLQMQIKKWNGPKNCENGGEKCLYTLVSVNKTMLVGTHETPVKHYIDNFQFTFKELAPGCMMHGFSSSATWYAVLDKGTNYCNLENLITGSGIDQSSGYSEKTSDAVCTQYSSADCDTY